MEPSMSFELESLSLKELRKLERDVAAAIANYETRTKANALAELEAKARELGFSLAELTGTSVSVKGKRAAASPKYKNPADPSETWSGRGRKPAWYAAALEQGATPESLAV
jgi:DNA-binding protein H-NS